MKYWKYIQSDEEAVENLAEEINVSKFVAKLAVNRDIMNAFEMDMFLAEGEDAMIESPYHLPGMKKAVDRINDALSKGDKITIYGDYDCDGITATSLLFTQLWKSSKAVSFYIPDRFSEGYGMNKDTIKNLYSTDTRLIVTVDNGINCVEEIEYANSLGIDVIVTDHHLPQAELPPAYAIINPHLEGNTSYKYLCGVGVAFKLVCALGGEENTYDLLDEYADFLAMGTIADMVPLVEENRIFCKAGIKKIDENPSLGVLQLKKVAGIEDSAINEGTIGFTMSPRINATGRLESGDLAVRLLLENDEERAYDLAVYINNINRRRKQICDTIYSEAVELINKYKVYKNKVIVVYKDGWNKGVIGIVAAKLLEKYNKSVIVFSKSGDTMVGSCRSVDNMNIFEALEYAKDYTVKYGGHKQAAGVTVKYDKINGFINKLEEYAKDISVNVPILNVECKIRANALNMDLVDTVSIFAPFGMQNPEPVFSMTNCEVYSIAPLREGTYVRLDINKGGAHFPVPLFNYSVARLPFEVGDKVDLAFTIGKRMVYGNENLNVLCKDIRPAGFDQDFQMESVRLYEALKDGKKADYTAITPVKDESALIYKYLKKEKYIENVEIIYNKFHTLGIGKVKVILAMFSSLGLVKISTKDQIAITENPIQVNLEESVIMKKIKALSIKE